MQFVPLGLNQTFPNYLSISLYWEISPKHCGCLKCFNGENRCIPRRLLRITRYNTRHQRR